MDVLIVGAGIAGSAAAYWLRRAGHRTTLVEHAPALRRGGYLIDFWGAGFGVAERMGIVPELIRRGVSIQRADQVDARGRRFASIDPKRFVRGSENRYISIARGDLAATVFEALAQELPGEPTELLLGDTVSAITDHGDRVRVELTGGPHRDVDLVVGADGVHSRVRELVFGPEGDFATELGIAVAAYELEPEPDPDLSNPETVATMYAEAGLQASRVTRPGGPTMVLLTFRHQGPLPTARDEQEAFLAQRLAGAGWEVPALLEALPSAPALYLDAASQIRMPSWSRGRVALVGDAAACVSLLAGQGSALALVEAYVLAAELDRCGYHRDAFAAYRQRLNRLLRGKQAAATGLGLVFAPRDRWQVVLRAALLWAVGLPFVDRFAYRSLRDAVELPAPAGG